MVFIGAQRRIRSRLLQSEQWLVLSSPYTDPSVARRPQDDSGFLVMSKAGNSIPAQRVINGLPELVDRRGSSLLAQQRQRIQRQRALRWNPRSQEPQQRHG
jgi:hypothetical protein